MWEASGREEDTALTELWPDSDGVALLVPDYTFAPGTLPFRHRPIPTHFMMTASRDQVVPL